MLISWHYWGACHERRLVYRKKNKFSSILKSLQFSWKDCNFRSQTGVKKYTWKRKGKKRKCTGPGKTAKSALFDRVRPVQRCTKAWDGQTYDCRDQQQSCKATKYLRFANGLLHTTQAKVNVSVIRLYGFALCNRMGTVAGSHHQDEQKQTAALLSLERRRWPWKSHSSLLVLPVLSKSLSGKEGPHVTGGDGHLRNQLSEQN